MKDVGEPMRRLLTTALVALTASLAAPEQAAPGVLADVLSPRVGAPTRCADLGGFSTEVLPDPTRVRVERALCWMLREGLRNPATGPRHETAHTVGWAAFEVAFAAGLVRNPQDFSQALCWAGLHYYRFIRPFTTGRRAARRVTRSEIRVTDAPRRCWPIWAR
jgi:hypothetical protein